MCSQFKIDSQWQQWHWKSKLLKLNRTMFALSWRRNKQMRMEHVPLQNKELTFMFCYLQTCHFSILNNEHLCDQEYHSSKLVLTRKHSSRMRTAHLPTVCMVAATSSGGWVPPGHTLSPPDMPTPTRGRNLIPKIPTQERTWNKGYPPVDRMTDSENITFPQLRWRVATRTAPWQATRS